MDINMIDVFRKGLSKSDTKDILYDVIVNILYLYFKLKYNDKYKMYSNMNKKEMLDKLIDGEVMYKLSYDLKKIVSESNIEYIFKYLDTKKKEDIIKYICFDYDSLCKTSKSTPKIVTNIVKKIFDKCDVYNILDMCSYKGNFLMSFNEFRYETVFGIDINKTYSEIAREKLSIINPKRILNQENILLQKRILNGVGIFNKDIFKSFLNRKFRGVFCHPPRERDIIDIPEEILGVNCKNKYSSTWAFVLRAIELLDDNNGVAIVLINEELLSNKKDINIRKFLLDRGYIDGAITITTYSEYESKNVTYTLLILNKRDNNCIKLVNLNYGHSNVSLISDDVVSKYFSSDDNTNIKVFTRDDFINNGYCISPKKIFVPKFSYNNAMRLGDLSYDIYRGYQLSKIEKNSLMNKIPNVKPYKIINIGDINDGVLDKDGLFDIYTLDNHFDRYVLEDNDFLLSLKGNSNKIVIYEKTDSEKYLPSGNFAIIRLKKDLIYPMYLKIFFESKKGMDILNSIKTGSSLSTLSFNDLKDILVPMVSLDKQRLIIREYLDEKDFIKLQEEKLQRSKEDLQKNIDSKF